MTVWSMKLATRWRAISTMWREKQESQTASNNDSEHTVTYCCTRYDAMSWVTLCGKLQQATSTVLIPLWSSTIPIPGNQRKLANCTKARSSWGKSCLLTSSIEYQQYFVADTFKVYFQQCISNALSIFFWLKIKITFDTDNFHHQLGQTIKKLCRKFFGLWQLFQFINYSVHFELLNINWN